MSREPGCRYYLTQAGIDLADAHELRRIAMTLHRWHELECGDSNDYNSFCVVRGKMIRDAEGKRAFEYDDDGLPWMEIHPHNGDKTSYNSLADRERGALRRLAKIMARYPGFASYVQGDPRGAALYILRPGDVREGTDVSSCYTNGIAVYK